MKRPTSAIAIFIFLIAVLLWASPAHASLLIRPPLYIGLNSGLVGNWSFNQEDIAGTTAYDTSGNANNGTLTNGPKGTIGKIGQGLSFSAAANQHVFLGQISSIAINSGSLTYSMWVFAKRNMGSFDLVWDYGGGCNSCNGYDMELGSGPWTANVSDGTLNYQAQLSDAPILNSWVLLTVVVDRSTNRLRTYVRSCFKIHASRFSNSRIILI